MTTKNVAQADLTSISTSLDRVEDIFMEGELREESLRTSGNGENCDLMVQEERTNSKVDFVARGSLNPEVVAGGGESAVVDNDRVLGINGTIDGTSSKRRNTNGRGITVACGAIAIVMIVAIVIVIKDALVISQESVKDELAI